MQTLGRHLLHRERSKSTYRLPFSRSRGSTAVTETLIVRTKATVKKKKERERKKEKRNRYVQVRWRKYYKYPQEFAESHATDAMTKLWSNIKQK